MEGDRIPLDCYIEIQRHMPREVITLLMTCKRLLAILRTGSQYYTMREEIITTKRDISFHAQLFRLEFILQERQLERTWQVHGRSTVKQVRNTGQSIRTIDYFRRLGVTKAIAKSLMRAHRHSPHGSLFFTFDNGNPLVDSNAHHYLNPEKTEGQWLMEFYREHQLEDPLFMIRPLGNGRSYCVEKYQACQMVETLQIYYKGAGQWIKRSDLFL